jgi:nitrogen regulatory protein PII
MKMVWAVVRYPNFEKVQRALSERGSDHDSPSVRLVAKLRFRTTRRSFAD